MDIERIKEDLKDLGYAVIDPLLDSEQLENLRTVRMRSLLIFPPKYPQIWIHL